MLNSLNKLSLNEIQSGTNSENYESSPSSQDWQSYFKRYFYLYRGNSHIWISVLDF